MFLEAVFVVLYLRPGMGSFISLKGMGKVVLVVHVTLRAQIVVKAHFALPAHATNSVLLTAVADDIWMADT